MPIFLPDGTQVSQRQVDKSAAVRDNLAVPTLSYSSQKTLEDDLNYLRSIVRQIKGTPRYDSPLSRSLEELYREMSEAVIHNAALTGTPVATETIPPGDRSNRLSTTRWVNESIDAKMVQMGADARFIHVQNSPPPLVSRDFGEGATTWSMWSIVHGLGKFPSVTVVNSADQVVVGLVEYVDTISLNIYFKSPELGRAFLN